MASREAFGRGLASTLLGLIVVSFLAACSGDSSPNTPQGESAARTTEVETREESETLTLEPADPVVRDQCAETARLVGYPVPCPTLLPAGSQPTRMTGPLRSWRFAKHFIRPGLRAFRDWTFLSVDFLATDVEGHLVISGAPSEVGPRRLVYLDPAPSEQVEVLGGSTFRPGARWVYAPPTSSSAYGGHTILLWSEGGHTYGVGFHGEGKRIKQLDRTVAEGIEMVEPGDSRP